MIGPDDNEFDLLWDYDRPAETETRFLALLPATQDKPDHHLQLVTQIARAQGLQRRFDEAHQTLDTVESSLPSASRRTRIRYLLERGRVFNSSGAKDRAWPLFEEALELADDDPAEAFYAVDAAHMLAIVAGPEESHAWNLRALTLAEAATDSRARGWRGALYNNIGWGYHAQGDYPAALEFLQRALDFRREQGQEHETRIARWCVARVRRDLGQTDEALAEQRALLAEYEALGRPSGYVFEEIGECLWMMGDEAAARPYFAAAHRVLAADPWLAANEPERLQRLEQLGAPSPGL